jgi:uroporphyrinogen decarboxylase
MMGLEGLCVAFYDQPQLVERMMAQRAEAMIAITDEVLRHTAFEVFWFWEDMAYNHGPLIDPRMFRRLALPHYRRVCDWLRSRGIEHIWLDSDGDIHELIPIWLEAGINGLWPFERQAGMDVVEVRRIYGHDLAMAGGISKRAVAEGGEAMRREVDRVMPLVEDGGYLPELDHSAPPDISWPNFCAYMSYLMHRLGRG